MLYFEIKKVFSKQTNKIAIILLAGIMVVTAYLAISNVKWVNENGETEYGISAIRKLKKAQNEWSGLLTNKKIAKVMKENKQINGTKEAKSKIIQQQEIAYSWRQGFIEIRDLINCSYGEFRNYDYYLIDSISADQANQFYNNRVNQISNWLNGEAKEMYSNKEKQFIMEQYGELKTPFQYSYAEGWKQMFQRFMTITMLVTLIIGFIVSGIFSCETRLKTDDIFYSSYYGRDKAIAAKVKAGFVITTSIYWLSILLYSGIVLSVLGIDGANCAIQIDRDSWKSLYNITFLQEYILAISGGYIGCLFIVALTMLISAKLKSAVIAVMIPFILIFTPSFLGFITSSFVSKVLSLLPDQLLQINNIVNLFTMYQIGNSIVKPIPILFVFYSILVIPLLFITYQIYKRAEIR